MYFFHIHNPKPRLIINHRHIWEQWLISSPWIKGGESLFSLFLRTLTLLPTVLTLPLLWNYTSRLQQCMCVCVRVFVHLCVYVSGSNEAEDEADMKSIRRCQFGLILMLSCLYTLCITHKYTVRNMNAPSLWTLPHTYTPTLRFHKFDMRVI